MTIDPRVFFTQVRSGSATAAFDILRSALKFERKQGRQEGFAEAREMAAAYVERGRPKWAVQIRALQPPRDEGKREGGDG